MTRLSPEAVSGVKRILWNGLGTFVAAALAAVLAWYVTANTNAEMTIQQQEIVAINAFDESGANLDSSVSDFLDAIVDGEVPSSVRKTLRTAITLHSAKAQRLSNIVGPKTVEDYTAGLGRLRELVDATEDVPTAMSAAKLHADILANKHIISRGAWARVSE